MGLRRTRLIHASSARRCVRDGQDDGLHHGAVPRARRPLTAPSPRGGRACSPIDAVAELEARDGLGRLPWRAMARSGSRVYRAPEPRPESRPGTGWLRRDEGRRVPIRRLRTHQLQTTPAGYCYVATGLATSSRRTDTHVCFDWPLGPPAGSGSAERLLAAIGDDVARPGNDFDRFGSRSGARLADRRSGGARRVMHLMILKSSPVTDRSW